MPGNILLLAIDVFEEACDLEGEQSDLCQGGYNIEGIPYPLEVLEAVRPHLQKLYEKEVACEYQHDFLDDRVHEPLPPFTMPVVLLPVHAIQPIVEQAGGEEHRGRQVEEVRE